MIWWLSFADESRPKGHQFLGVALVEAPDFRSAITKCHHLGINPGGEVQGGFLHRLAIVPEEFKNRRLSRAEAEQVESMIGYGEA